MGKDQTPKKPKNKHVIPEVSRVHLSFTKKTVKELKKLSIDLEMPDAEVIVLAIESLSKRVGEMDIDNLSQDEIKNALFSDA